MQKAYATFILLVIASTELGASPVEPLWQKILAELELEAQLKIPQYELVKYPHILISSYSTYQWLERSASESSLLNSKPPQLTNQCPPMTVFQQWFDAEYRQVGTQHALASQTHQIHIPPEAVPEQAKFQRVSARIFEYQSDIKIEYLHRVAVPYR